MMKNKKQLKEKSDELAKRSQQLVAAGIYEPARACLEYKKIIDRLINLTAIQRKDLAAKVKINANRPDQIGLRLLMEWVLT